MVKQNLLVDRSLEDLVVEKTKELIEKKKRERSAARLPIVEWAEKHWYCKDPITDDVGLVVLAPHQRSILKAAFTKDENGFFPFRLVLLSTVKKSGKTAMAAMVTRWIAEEQTIFGEVAVTGNDQRQAKERSYQQIQESVRLTPGFRNKGGTEGVLPDRWHLQSSKMICLTSGSKIEALSVDARGEAGAKPDLTGWT